jgi:hypothetical protein
VSIGDGWKLCPHIFGWSYNDPRNLRFCRMCAKRQHLELHGAEYREVWVDGPLSPINLRGGADQRAATYKRSARRPEEL